MATNNSTQQQPSLAPTSSSSDSSSSSYYSPTKSTKPPPQEWLLEYVTSHVTQNKNSPNNNNMNQEWSMQKVICIAISIIIYIGIILWLLVSISSGDKVTLSSSLSKTCDITSDGGQSNNSDNMSCSSTPVGDDVSIHRGKEIGPNIKASDLAEAYQSIKSEYESLALHPTSNTNWQLLSSHSDGSEVSLLEHPTDLSCPYVRMTSVMPGSIQQVWDFLDLKNWETTMPKMDPFYEGLTIHGEYKHKGIEMKLARKTIKRLITFGKRDFTFVSVSDQPRRDGTWVSGTVSVVTDKIPRMKGYVRAYQDSIAFYEAMEHTNDGKPQMKLTIVFRIDMNDTRDGGDGGFVPMWAYVKTVGTTGMTSVQNMKRQLEIMAKERDSNEKCDRSWLARIRNGTEKC